MSNARIITRQEMVMGMFTNHRSCTYSRYGKNSSGPMAFRKKTRVNGNKLYQCLILT